MDCVKDVLTTDVRPVLMIKTFAQVVSQVLVSTKITLALRVRIHCVQIVQLTFKSARFVSLDMARIIMGNVLNVRKIFVRDVVLIS